MIKVEFEKSPKVSTSKTLTNYKTSPAFPSMAAGLWKGRWKQADLRTLNTLCNLFKCTPNDILGFTPDQEE